MNCPVCNRNNAVRLSVCPSCGTMLGDSRAELLNKVYSVAKTADAEAKTNLSSLSETSQSVKSAIHPEANRVSAATSSISTKLTSPTLVEFRTESATIPEWRLQLQNTVRQRNERVQNVSEKPLATASARQPNLVTKGATALKIESLAEVIESEPVEIGNPKLASALERIKNSRQKFLVEEEPKTVAPEPAPAKANKSYPFYIASKTNDADVKATVNPTVKPKLATSLRAETKDLDTNKLPPLPAAKIATSFEADSAVSVPQETNVEAKPDRRKEKN